MKVIDVIKEVPENRPEETQYQTLNTYNTVFNEATNLILNSEVDISKAVDVGKIEKTIIKHIEEKNNGCGFKRQGGDIVPYGMVINGIAQAILTNLNKCGKDIN